MTTPSTQPRRSWRTALAGVTAGLMLLALAAVPVLAAGTTGDVTASTGCGWVVWWKEYHRCPATSERPSHEAGASTPTHSATVGAMSTWLAYGTCRVPLNVRSCTTSGTSMLGA